MASKKPRSSTVTAVATADDNKHFRKTNTAIGLKVREGRLTLLGRKVFNVMMYNAQKVKHPGVNAPIDSASAQKYFWIPLSDLAKDAAYDSKDTEFLKNSLEELQNIKLQMESDVRWTSERLVSSVTLVNPRGLKKHAGQVWFGYAFPPEVFEIVMSPETYTHMSIFFQGLLRSGAALALYEVCRRFATNPSHMTLIDTYEAWYAMLSGTPMDGSVPPPYKYWKRDTLKPAIAEVNTLTDITVELVEHKNGRRVERLQFRVELSKQPKLDFPTPPVIDLDLVGKVMKFGFSQADAMDITAQHAEEKVRASIAFVEARMAQAGSPSLDSPAAYFRWSLKEGAAAAQGLLESSNAKANKPGVGKPAGSSIMERFLSARGDEAMVVYRELDDSQRRALFERFRSQSSSRVVSGLRSPDNPMARALFSRWYAEELWGAPTVEAMATFVERFGLQT